MADSAKQLVDRLMNDAQFRDSLETAPTLHDKGKVLEAAGYGDVNAEEIQAAVKEQLRAMSAGVQVDPARVKRVEEMFLKVATDEALQQALQSAATPEAARDVMAKAGYGDITLDDLKAAAAAIAQREELSDQELELVSGGSVAPGISDYGLGRMVAGGTTIVTAATGLAMGGPPGLAVGLGIAAIGMGITALEEWAPPISKW